MSSNLENVKIRSLDEFKGILDTYMSERKNNKIVSVTPETLYSILLELINSATFKKNGGNLIVGGSIPNNSDGFNNDIYLNSVSGIWYIKKNDIWEITLDLSTVVSNNFNKIVGSIDASTNPNYPSASEGDGYRITHDGKIGGIDGEEVEVGDVVFAITNTSGGTQLEVGNDFYILQTNITQASESTEGYAKIATQSETNLLLSDETIITPLKLGSHLNTYTYTETIGNGVDAVFTITHNLNNLNVDINVYDNITNTKVFTTTEIVDNNNAKLSFLKAPEVSKYKVIIKSI